MKVLIIEDSELFVDLIRAHLSDHPEFDVVGTASTAPDARKLNNDLQPDLVLLDVWLSDGSSFRLLPELLDGNPGVRVVVMTADASEPLRQRCLERGAYGFFDKMDHVEKLLRLVKAVVDTQPGIVKG